MARPANIGLNIRQALSSLHKCERFLTTIQKAAAMGSTGGSRTTRTARRSHPTRRSRSTGETAT